MSSVPFRNREPAQPLPYFFIASMAASLTFGMVGKTEIIVRPEHDHFSALDDHLGVLRRFHDTKIRIEPRRHHLFCSGICTAFVKKIHDLPSPVVSHIYFSQPFSRYHCQVIARPLARGTCAWNPRSSRIALWSHIQYFCDASTIFCLLSTASLVGEQAPKAPKQVRSR